MCSTTTSPLPYMKTSFIMVLSMCVPSFVKIYPPKWSYCVHKGVKEQFCDPYCTKKFLKNQKNMYSPQIQTYCYGLEHVCIEFGENMSTKTCIIVPTRCKRAIFATRYYMKKILEKSEKHVRPQNSNSAFFVV